MDKQKITLNWQGPFSFYELLNDENLRQEFSESGVYIFNEKKDSLVRPAYIGKAEDLLHRQVQHYMGYLGGTYTLPEEFYRNKGEWYLDIKNERVLNTIFNLGALKEVMEDGFNYVQQLEIRLALVDSDEISIVERNLLYDYQPTRTTWGTKSTPPNRVDIKNVGNFPFKIC